MGCSTAGRREHKYLVNASRVFVCRQIRSTRVIAKSVRGYADGWGGVSGMQMGGGVFQSCCRKKIKCGSMFAHTSIMFKKKWKPAEAGNTRRGRETHVRAKRTESTCDF